MACVLATSAVITAFKGYGRAWIAVIIVTAVKGLSTAEPVGRARIAVIIVTAFKGLSTAEPVGRAWIAVILVTAFKGLFRQVRATSSESTEGHKTILRGRPKDTQLF